MEQVLLQQHTRLVRDTSKILNVRVRRTIEFLTLFIAFLFMFMLFILHMIYITNSSNVAVNCIMTYFEDQLLHVNNSYDILTKKNSYDLIRLTLNNTLPDSLHSKHCINTNQHFMHTLSSNQIVHESLKDNLYLFAYDRGLLMLNRTLRDAHNFTVLNIDVSIYAECFGPPIPAYIIHRYIGFDLIVLNWAIAAFDGKGFLYKANTNELFNLNFAGDFVSKKGISLTDEKHSVMQSTHSHMRKVLQTIWAKYLQLSKYLQQNIGFDEWKNNSDILYLIYSGVTITNTRWQFISQSIEKLTQYLLFRLGVVFSTTFIFFITTTLISYTLRETQERMLRFTYQLQYHITHRLPFMPLVFTHLTESLVFVPIMVGIHFFLAEFFSDQMLAFLVSLMVWMGEVFSVLSLRTRASIRYFPKLFAGYFYLFHIYFFSFPFGFTYLALLTTILFVLHATMHLWNVYEVPAFEQGLVNPVIPRIGLGATTASAITASSQQQPDSAALSPSSHQPVQAVGTVATHSRNNNRQYSHRYLTDQTYFSPSRSARTHSNASASSPSSGQGRYEADHSTNVTTGRRSTIGPMSQVPFPSFEYSGTGITATTSVSTTSAGTKASNHHRIRSSSHSIHTTNNNSITSSVVSSRSHKIKSTETSQDHNNNNSSYCQSSTQEAAEYRSMVNMDFGIRLHSNSDLENVYNHTAEDDSGAEESYTLDLAPAAAVLPVATTRYNSSSYKDNTNTICDKIFLSSRSIKEKNLGMISNKKTTQVENINETSSVLTSSFLSSNVNVLGVNTSKGNQDTISSSSNSRSRSSSINSNYNNIAVGASIYETIEMRRKRLLLTAQQNTKAPCGMTDSDSNYNNSNVSNISERLDDGGKESVQNNNDNNNINNNLINNHNHQSNNSNRLVLNNDPSNNTDDYGYQSSQFTVFK